MPKQTKQNKTVKNQSSPKLEVTKIKTINKKSVLKQTELNFKKTTKKIRVAKNVLKEAVFDTNWLQLKDKVKEAKSCKNAVKMTYETNVWRAYLESIAEPLLNESVLICNYKHQFRVVDVELYFNDGLTHHDTFLSPILDSE